MSNIRRTVPICSLLWLLGFLISVPMQGAPVPLPAVKKDVTAKELAGRWVMEWRPVVGSEWRGAPYELLADGTIHALTVDVSVEEGTYFGTWEVRDGVLVVSEALSHHWREYLAGEMTYSPFWRWSAKMSKDGTSLVGSASGTSPSSDVVTFKDTAVRLTRPTKAPK